VSALLANLDEYEAFYQAAQGLRDAHQTNHHPANHKLAPGFTSLNLVFSAPHTADYGLPSDRSTIVNGVFRSPMQAIHVCGELQIACMTHVEYCGDTLEVTALEYSRSHRETMLRQEFGSWLLEEHIEKSVIATTLLGEVVFWNRYAAKLYQYSTEEAIGQNIMNLSPSEMTQDQAAEIMTNLGKGEHWAGMFKVKRKDKSMFMAHVSDTPVLDPSGSVKYIVGVSDDYTEMHNLMETLEHLNADLEKEVNLRTAQLVERENDLKRVGAAIQASDTGVVITGVNHAIDWFNEAVTYLLGVKGDSLLQALPWELRSLKDQYYAESGEELNHWIEKSLAAGTADETKTTVAAGQSTVSLIFDRKQSVDNDDDDGVKALSVAIQKLPEGQLANHHMVLFRDYTVQKKANEAQMAAEAAAAAGETKTEMMQMLSHELRSPLQGIMGVASTMMLDLTPEEDNIYDGVSMILASSRLLLTLINNVLDIRKIDLEMIQKIDLDPIDVVECIQDSIRFCMPYASVNDVELTVADQDQTSSRYILANRLRMEQVLINLITNSIKYTTPFTQVVVSARPASLQEALAEIRDATASDLSFFSDEVRNEIDNGSDDVMIVSVRDHGKGIPPGEAHLVFAPYTQLSISAEKDRAQKRAHAFTGQSSGTGLGLNLVMKFIERMNGHVWCKNSPTEGVTFSFYVPQASKESGKDSPESSLPSYKATLSPSAAARVRLLLVDDSVINVKVLNKMASRLGVKQVEVSCKRLESNVHHASVVS
jgi:PAS domain S-box-containing protein